MFSDCLGWVLSRRWHVTVYILRSFCLLSFLEGIGDPAKLLLIPSFLTFQLLLLLLPFLGPP